MKRAAAKKTTTPVDSDLQQLIDSQVAKSRFLGATANMGWRLAITVVVPLVVGVKLDEKFHSAPSLTLAGLFIAVAAGAAAVWATVKEVNEEQAEMDAKKSKKRRQKRAT